MSTPLLQVENAVKHFATRGGVVRAVDGASLTLARGETLGLVGESGCGKSTLARLVVSLIRADSGGIALDGTDVALVPRAAFRRRVQIVFQDPFRSLNPRRTVGSAIGEPLLIHKIVPRTQVRSQVGHLLEEVGLSPDVIDHYPHEFSGGQRQRIGIARALALRPELIVLDEPVSALDVSVQAQIVQLLQNLQRQHGLSYLFISHNLAVVRHLCDRVAVMYLGKIVETAAVADLYAQPLHPYTAALLDAVPEPDPAQPVRVRLSGDPPDPMHVPPGCRFHPRCRLAREVAGATTDVPEPCSTAIPELRSLAPAHHTACHYAEKLLSTPPAEPRP